MALNFEDYNVPEHTQDALTRYIENRLSPGGFLTSVLSNDLFGAMGRADIMNRYAIYEICMWLYNEAPSNCFGSPEKVREYLEGKDND